MNLKILNSMKNLFIKQEILITLLASSMDIKKDYLFVY